MDKKLKVLTVCGAGVGTSNLMRSYVEDAFKELGIKVQVENAGLSRAKSLSPDLVITSPSFKSLGDELAVDVIILQNLFDKDGIKAKIAEWIKSKE